MIDGVFIISTFHSTRRDRFVVIFIVNLFLGYSPHYPFNYCMQKRGTVCSNLDVHVLALRKPFVTDVGITAPRYMRGDHYTFSCHMVGSFLGLEHARRRHNASYIKKWSRYATPLAKILFFY